MIETLPSRKELQCAGISFIISQILWGIAWLLHSIDYDAYDVQNESEIVELHKVLSSSKYRTEIEIACACLWIAFPLTLIAIYAISKTQSVMFASTPVIMLVYVLEKSYIIFISFISIIVPALMLVSVSYDWSFGDNGGDNGGNNINTVPTGYYVQLYVIVFEMELLDCMTIADATFMISYFLLVRSAAWLSVNGDRKWSELNKFWKASGCSVKIREIIMNIIGLSMFIIYLLALFKFAKSGFFSPTDHSRFLVVFIFIIKIIIGIRMIVMSKNESYDLIKQIFVDHEKEDDNTGYDMDKLVNVETNNTNNKNNDNQQV